MDKHHIDWSLYLITDRRLAGGRDLVDVVRAALRGGVTIVQLRDKTATTNDLIEMGRRLHEVTLAAGVPLIINDRVDVALAINAEGVHLGPPDDMPAGLARPLLGPERIIGVSAGTPEIALQAARDGADYVGTGDIFGTASKPDADEPIGLAGLRAVVTTSPIPVVGIGGVNQENAAEAIAAGADGVALISAIMAADDPERAALELRQTIDRARQR